MENRDYIQTDNNVYLNTKYIRWIKKMNECVEICSRFDGCVHGFSTHSVCKKYSSESYKKLNEMIEPR
jgi:hypothetical protein